MFGARPGIPREFLRRYDLANVPIQTKLLNSARKSSANATEASKRRVLASGLPVAVSQDWA